MAKQKNKIKYKNGEYVTDIPGATIIISDYDKVAEAWGKPMFVPKLAPFLREMKTLVNTDNGNGLNKYPHDHTLFILGEWDQKTGSITPKNALLVEIAELVTNEKENI